MASPAGQGRPHGKGDGSQQAVGGRRCAQPAAAPVGADAWSMGSSRHPGVVARLTRSEHCCQAAGGHPGAAGFSGGTEGWCQPAESRMGCKGCRQHRCWQGGGGHQQRGRCSGQCLLEMLIMCSGLVSMVKSAWVRCLDWLVRPADGPRRLVWDCEAARRWVCSEVCRSAGLDWAGYFFLSGKSDN